MDFCTKLRKAHSKQASLPAPWILWSGSVREDAAASHISFFFYKLRILYQLQKDSLWLTQLGGVCHVFFKCAHEWRGLTRFFGLKQPPKLAIQMLTDLCRRWWQTWRPSKAPGNPGVDYHALLQGIFLTQGSNPGLFSLLHWQADSLPLTPHGQPLKCMWYVNYISMKLQKLKRSLLGSLD